MKTIIGQCTDGPGERTRLGYVRLWNGGDRVLAHVAAWKKANRDIPKGMELDHLCRNRWCRNPDHLEAVTHAENSRRCPHVKLTLEIANKIRSRYADGDVSLQALANEYSVSKQAIHRIVRMKMWL